MNSLGLDYGAKYIGVALATGPLAEPLTTIATDHFFAELPEIIEKYGVTKVVIGSEVPQEFIDQLSDILCEVPSLSRDPLSIADETLSSADARQSLLHTTQTRRRENEHSAAATIILQSWLDNK